MPKLARQPLGQLLLGKGLLQPAQLDGALAEQGAGGRLKLLGEILVEMRHCTEAQVAEALAESYGLPFAAVSPKLADPRVVSLLPREFCRRNAVLPLFLVEEALTVAVAEPADIVLIEQIARLTGKKVQVVVAAAADVRKTLALHQPEQCRFNEPADEALDEPSLGGLALDDDAPADTQAAAAVKLLAHCVHLAAKEAATEVHLEPMSDALRVRFRVDGGLTERLRQPSHLLAPLVARLRALASLDSTARRPQQGVAHVTLDRKPIEIHFATMPGPLGERIVLRLLGGERGALDLEKLGFGYETLKQWRKLLAMPAGLIVVSGPAGSGRGTTLYASLESRAADDQNVCTLEDRISHPLTGVNQFAVDESAGLGWGDALRGLLRQEPNVLMVGDLPTPDAAQIAARAAMAGRLVLAGLPTLDPAAGVTRLLSLGVEPYVVGAALTGVLSQRLVKKLCSQCKEPVAPTISQRRLLERHVGSVDLLHQPKGCPRCKGTGWAGRIGLFELLVIDDALSDLVNQGATLAQLREAVARLDVKTLRADGMEKVRAGVTTLDELFRVAP